ncbi:MAG: DUF2442 domain-containing protein [Bacteroidota bacterium]|nr:DUF2442 domain-containing protein [Bacteroidota bacterium]
MYYLIKIIEAEYLGDYKVRLTFSNGKVKDVNLAGKLTGEMFQPLRDKNIFMQFRLDRELGTIAWPNGADLAPYSLYEMGTIPQEKRKKTAKPMKVHSRMQKKKLYAK